MSGVVPKKVRNKRSKMLRSLSVKKRRAFYESQLGETLPVLFEGENKEGYIHGFTENYVKVKAPWNPELVNTLHEVKLREIDNDGLVRFDFQKKEVEA
jgi:threonylcarbamoyladenosine tRNA methylthiotransferase MtaB